MSDYEKKWIMCINMQSKYAQGNVDIMITTYASNPTRIAIGAFCHATGEPEFTATVNLPDQMIEEDHVFIRDTEENEGIAAELIRHGIIGPEVRKVRSGYIEIGVHKLLDKGL